MGYRVTVFPTISYHSYYILPVVNGNNMQQQNFENIAEM